MQFLARAFGTQFENPTVVVQDNCDESDNLCKRQLALLVQELTCLVLIKLKEIMLKKILLKRVESAVSN